MTQDDHGTQEGDVCWICKEDGGLPLISWEERETRVHLDCFRSMQAAASWEAGLELFAALTAHNSVRQGDADPCTRDNA